MVETNSVLCKSAHLETPFTQALIHPSTHRSTLPSLHEEPSCAISRYQLYHQRLGREPSFSTHQGKSRAYHTGCMGGGYPVLLSYFCFTLGKGASYPAILSCYLVSGLKVRMSPGPSRRTGNFHCFRCRLLVRAGIPNPG